MNLAINLVVEVVIGIKRVVVDWHDWVDFTRRRAESREGLIACGRSKVHSNVVAAISSKGP